MSCTEEDNKNNEEEAQGTRREEPNQVSEPLKENESSINKKKISTHQEDDS